jgi:proteasome lid subunit RPN8/RPN11
MLLCPANLLEETLGHLQRAGQQRTECVVLWLGRREGENVRVVEAYRPEQRVRRDQFLILPPEMEAIMTHLRERRLMVTAQVHSHPLEAFHSEADDEGAIVRHVGALSFVVPRFAARTDVASFLSDAALYELQEGDIWLEVPRGEVEKTCNIVF